MLLYVSPAFWNLKQWKGSTFIIFLGQWSILGHLLRPKQLTRLSFQDQLGKRGVVVKFSTDDSCRAVRRGPAELGSGAWGLSEGLWDKQQSTIGR